MKEKKKTKWKKIILIVIITLVVIQGAAFVALYFVGDKMIESVIESDFDKVLDENIADDKVLEKNENENASSAKTTENVKDNSSGTKQTEQGTQTKEKKVLTVSQMKEAKDKVSSFEKVKVASVVLRKLSMSEINDLKGMTANGITEQEKEQVKQILDSKFSSSELDEIKSMYIKYLEGAN